MNNTKSPLISDKIYINPFTGTERTGSEWWNIFQESIDLFDIDNDGNEIESFPYRDLLELEEKECHSENM